MGRVKCEIELVEINTIEGARITVWGPRREGKRLICHYIVIPTREGFEIKADELEECDIRNPDKVFKIIGDFVSERWRLIESVFEFFEDLRRKANYRGNVHVTFSFRSKMLRAEIPCTDIE